jgi:hypothetical protein
VEVVVAVILVWAVLINMMVNVIRLFFCPSMLQVVDYVGGKRSALASLSLVSLTLLSLGYVHLLHHHL